MVVWQRHFWVCLGFLVVGSLFPKSALATKDSVYKVSVQVDVTRPSSAQAKEDALIIGREKAFSKLLGRLALGVEGKSLKEFSSEKIPEYVKSFSVQKEQHSSVRYMATLAFDFDSKKIQSLLDSHRIAFSEVGSTRLVVLPVLIRDGRFLLWEDTENIWYKAWTALDASEEDIQIICPLSDLEDQIACPLSDLGGLKKPMLVKLKERYKADDVLLAILSIDTEGAMGGNAPTHRGYVRYLPFALRNIKDAHGLGPFSLPANPETFLGQVRDQLFREVAEKWRAAETQGAQTYRVTQFKIKSDNLEEWQRFSKRLENLSMVKDIKIQAFSRGEHLVWITFKGELAAFKEVLVGTGFSVNMENDLVVLS